MGNGVCPDGNAVPCRANGERVPMGKSNGRSRQREDGESSRLTRLKELIREEVNFVLRNEARNPRLQGVVITMVELTGDGSCARLWFTAESPEDLTDALDGAAGFLRSHLAETLACKRTPELRFRRDPISRAVIAAAATMKVQ